MTDTTCTDCGPAASADTPAPSSAPTSGSSVSSLPLATTHLSSATASSPSSSATASGFITGAGIEPPALVTPHVLIEFCDRCRWAPRASWMQTELMLTFPPPHIRTVTLQPMNTPETGGRFRVWVDVGGGKGWQLVWDRKSEGGFPELKVLKQRVRNLVQPDLDLGHSDIKKHQH